MCRQEAEKRSGTAARLDAWRVELSIRQEAFDALRNAVIRMVDDCQRSKPAPFDPKEHPAALAKCFASFVGACPRRELQCAWQAVNRHESLLALARLWHSVLTAAEVEAVFGLACQIVDDCLAGSDILSGQLAETLRTGSGVDAPRWATVSLGALAGILPWPACLVRVGNADEHRLNPVNELSPLKDLQPPQADSTEATPREGNSPASSRNLQTRPLYPPAPTEGSACAAVRPQQDPLAAIQAGGPSLKAPACETAADASRLAQYQKGPTIKKRRTLKRNSLIDQAMSAGITDPVKILAFVKEQDPILVQSKKRDISPASMMKVYHRQRRTRDNCSRPG
jgi:hypothetical protein